MHTVYGSPTGSGKESLEVRDINVRTTAIQMETKIMQADNFPQSKVRGGQCYHLLLQSPLTLPQKSKHSSRFCLVPSLPYTLSNSINLLKNKQKKTKQTNKQTAASLVSALTNGPGLQNGNGLNVTSSFAKAISFYRTYPIIMSPIAPAGQFFLSSQTCITFCLDRVHNSHLFP